MDFRILGPLEVLAAAGPFALGGTQQSALLAVLQLEAGRVLSRHRPIDALGGDR